MNPKTISTLDNTPPPPNLSPDAVSALARDIAAGHKPRGLVAVTHAIYSRVVAIETERGLPTSRFSLNYNALAARLIQLEVMEAQPAAPVLSVAPVVIAAPVAPVEAAAGILTATLADFRRMDAATRAQFAQDGGSLLRGDFETLSVKSKMDFMRGGGKVADGGTVASRYAPGVVRAGAPMEPTGDFARNGASMARAAFENLKPDAQMQFMRKGGKITD